MLIRQVLLHHPKGAKADGNVTISGGKLNISVTGKSDGSEGLGDGGKVLYISLFFPRFLWNGTGNR